VNPIFWNVFFLKKSECQWGTSRYEQNIYQNQRRIEMGCGSYSPKELFQVLTMFFAVAEGDISRVTGSIFTPSARGH